MLNCPTCEFADFEKDKCTRLLKHLPHICPYAEERKPRNHFEEIKAMNMEELAEWIYSIQDEDTFRKENYLQPLSKERWLTWLKEEIKND